MIIRARVFFLFHRQRPEREHSANAGVQLLVVDPIDWGRNVVQRLSFDGGGLLDRSAGIAILVSDMKSRLLEPSQDPCVLFVPLG